MDIGQHSDMGRINCSYCGEEHGGRYNCQAEVNSVLSADNESRKQQEIERNKTAPRCHNRPMSLRDWNEGDNWESWWECSVCGHTKGI